MKLSQNFELEDLIKSPTATAAGIKNAPGPTELQNLMALAVNVLEPVKAHFGHVQINSGYRGPDLNKLVGGSTSSQHCKGQAVDFEIPGVPNKDVAIWVTNNIKYDQCILEFWVARDASSGWVHCSYNKDAPGRKQKLIAQKNGKKTIYRAVKSFDEAV